MPSEATTTEPRLQRLTGSMSRRLFQAPPGRLADRLGRLSGFVFCCVLPVAMVLANKSAPVWLALGAILANAAVLLDGGRDELLQRYRSLLLSAPALLLLAFVGLAVLSFGWSIAPAMTARGLSETVPELVFGLTAVAAWPMTAKAGNLRWFAVGIATASVLIWIESNTGLPLHRLVHARVLADDLKRSSIPSVLLLWPALQFHLKRSQWGVALVLAALALAGGMVSHSTATVAGAVVGFAMLLLGSIAPRAAASVFAVFIVACLAVAPWTGSLVDRFVPPDTRASMDTQHASQRLLIWNTFEQHVWERPLLGHGFDTSFRLGEVSLKQASGFGPMQEEAIRDIHPHNQLLQIWIDFGLIGALFILVALAFLLRRLKNLDAAQVAPRLGFLTSAAILALVGVQAWDAWWLATIAVSQAAFAVLRATPEPGTPGSAPMPLST